MFDNPDKEWRRLTTHYASLYDEELLGLADGYHDLTQMAQQVLRDEMKKRGLGDPLAPASVDAARSQREREARNPALEAAESDAASEHIEYTWKIALCDCSEWPEAWQVREALRLEGIQSWIDSSQRYQQSASGPRVMVAADELEKARAVLSRPIPQDIIDQSHMEIPEYEPPSCPACRAPDPVLESAEPVNTWRCEACGREWTDPVENPEPAG